MGLEVTYRLGVETFFGDQLRKVLKVNTLASDAPNCWLQSIVKEELTRKVFQNIDLAGPDCRLDLGASGGMILRCKCARVHCALFVARVKVVRHMEGELGCGKVRARYSCRFHFCSSAATATSNFE